MRQEQTFKVKFVFILVCFNLILYAFSLTYDFVWDDRSLILQNPSVQNTEKILDSFKYPLSIFGEQYNYYRPVSLISFVIDRIIWKTNALGFHLTNLLLHILVVIFIAYLSYHLFGYLRGILISGVFTAFAVHIENVTFISGRMDIFATLFMLIALVLYFSKMNLLVLRITLCGISFLMALLSKEIAFVFPLIFVLIVVTTTPRKKWNDHFRIGALFIIPVFMVYLFLRISMLRNFVISSGSGVSFFSRVIDIPRLIVFYLQLLIFPYNLNARHYGFVSGNSSAIFQIASLVVLTIIVTMVVIWRKNNQIVFGFLWFLIGILPVLNIFPLPGIPVAERFLYLPSIGFAIVIVGLLPAERFSLRTMDLKRIITVVFILAIVANNVIFSFIRMPVWHDEEIFFNTMVAQNPKSSLAHHNLGHYYYRKGEWQKAEEEYMKSIFINPSFPAPHASLGDIYTRTGRYQEAIKEYNIYLKLLPSAPNRAATIYRIRQLQNLLEKP